MAFFPRPKKEFVFESSPNLSKLRSWSSVQYGRPPMRTLSSSDMTDMEQLDRIMLREIESSLELEEIEFFESIPNLRALKTFLTVLEEDAKKSGAFSSEDTSSVQNSRSTMRRLSSTNVADMEQFKRRSLDETQTSLEQGNIELFESITALDGPDAKESGNQDRGAPKDETEILLFGIILLSSRLPNATALLNKLEIVSICHKVLLNRIQLTRQRMETTKEQLDELQQAIIKAQEIIKRLQYLVQEHFENRIQEICKCIDLLEKACNEIVNKMQTKTEPMLYEDKDKKTVLCSLLGLQLDFLDHLKEVSPRIRNHRSLSEWVVTFLWENYESLSYSKKSPLSKELLISIGFDSTGSTVETVLARSRAGSMQQHIEPCEWAEIFIEDEFKYSLWLSPQADKFPFQSGSTNTWFPHSIENENGETIRVVQIINIVVRESKMSGKTACSKLLDQTKEVEQEEHTVLFHGTDHESARDILDRGIDLSAGRQKRDFSCGLGFYLTNNCNDAINWAKSTTAKPAILMFHVKCDCLNKFRKQVFLETNADDMTKWHKIVSSCRSGKLTADIQKLFTEFDSIEGPKAIITGRNEADELTFEPKPSSHQMCLFSEDLADEFYKNLHSVLFFDHS